MKEYTIEQRRAYARKLPFAELMSLANQYDDPTPNTLEAEIYTVLTEEVERRILAWEIAEV